MEPNEVIHIRKELCQIRDRVNHLIDSLEPQLQIVESPDLASIKGGAKFPFYFITIF